MKLACNSALVEEIFSKGTEPIQNDLNPSSLRPCCYFLSVQATDGGLDTHRLDIGPTLRIFGPQAD